MKAIVSFDNTRVHAPTSCRPGPNAESAPSTINKKQQKQDKDNRVSLTGEQTLCDVRNVAKLTNKGISTVQRVKTEFGP